MSSFSYEVEYESPADAYPNSSYHDGIQMDYYPEAPCHQDHEIAYDQSPYPHEYPKQNPMDYYEYPPMSDVSNNNSTKRNQGMF